MPTALSIAIELAAAGLPCFPVGNNKHPTTENGFHAATADRGVVRELWAKSPGPLVGVPTGVVSGIDVLDVDRNPTARLWWCDNRDRIPSTRTHRTRNGGLHLLFQHALGLRNSAGKIARGVDVRGDGGYIVWWPAAGRPVLCDVSPTRWPAWVLDELQQKVPPPRRAVIPDDLQIRRILAYVSAAPIGERNSRTFWAACRLGEMTASGLLSEDDALALVVETAMARGLPLREALATARSGIGRRR